MTAYIVYGTRSCADERGTSVCDPGGQSYQLTLPIPDRANLVIDEFLMGIRANPFPFSGSNHANDFVSHSGEREGEGCSESLHCGETDQC